MKQIRIGNHFRKIVLLLINNGFLEEVTPPPTSQKVLMNSKKSEDGKAWTLTIPNPSLALRIEEGEMFIDYTSKRTGYQWTRNLTDFINSLQHARMTDVIQTIKEEHAAMKTIVKSLIFKHSNRQTIASRVNLNVPVKQETVL